VKSFSAGPNGFPAGTTFARVAREPRPSHLAPSSDPRTTQVSGHKYGAIHRVSALATSDDAALLRAVLANPADDAPRLVYADWLDERGDPRGEYLRADLEVARPQPRGRWFLEKVERAQELQARCDPGWVLAVSRGCRGRVIGLTLYQRAGEWDPGSPVRLANPGWVLVEEAISRLDRRRYLEVRLTVRGDREGEGSCDLSITGGRGAWWFDGTRYSSGVRWGRDSRVYWDPTADRARAIPLLDGVHELVIPAERVCVDPGVVVRAAKWWYYFGAFAPDVPWRASDEGGQGLAVLSRGLIA
jgi:uncharacterized protein (TIGR02996 family)